MMILIYNPIPMTSTPESIERENVYKLFTVIHRTLPLVVYVALAFYSLLLHSFRNCENCRRPAQYSQSPSKKRC